MPYTAEQQERIKQDFALRRRRQFLVSIPFGLMVVAFAAFGEKAGPEPLGIPVLAWTVAVLALIGGLLVFSFRNWRCPACNKYLGKGMSPKFCPECGVAFK